MHFQLQLLPFSVFCPPQKKMTCEARLIFHAYLSMQNNAIHEYMCSGYIHISL